MFVLGEVTIRKRDKGILWSEGNVLSFDRGVGYLGVCICQNLSNCMCYGLNICIPSKFIC